MILKNIQIFPKGRNGWYSDSLLFGENVTQLYGPNGCGKTPLIQSIVYCLGYQCSFRQDIYENCSHVILRIKTPKGGLKIKRFFDRDFNIEVTDYLQVKNRFFDEKEYTKYIFKILKKRFTSIVTNTNKRTNPYLSSILPIFYIDQDEGYRDYYSPPTNFIKDQFSEMVRILFDFPVKHSFDAKKAIFAAKERLKQLDKKVESYRLKLNIAQTQLKPIHSSIEDIDRELKRLEDDREQIKHTDSCNDESVNIYEQMIVERNRALRRINDEIYDLQKRKESITQIIDEINTEIDTLNINEEARRIFLSFNEICDSPNCKLFSSSSESYSKNLLYLKDQIKDLERNSLIDNVRLDQLLTQKKEEQNQLSVLVKERKKIIDKNTSSTIVDAISKIENRLFELRTQRSDVESLNLLKRKYLSILEERDRAIDKVESLSSNKVSTPKLMKLRADLKQSFINWLDIIGTKNVSRDITYKGDFKPILGNEMIKQLTGSTRTRAVLAYHAALIEQAVAYDGEDNFNFFILDTPRQHEIHINDLKTYIAALKNFSQKTNTQIVFSTTDYRYEGDDFDRVWTPQYPGPEQNMFLNMVPHKTEGKNGVL